MNLFSPAACAALLLLGAHCLRAGLSLRAAVCAALAALVWSRRAWVRPALMGLLFAAALYWTGTAADLIRWRAAWGQPWLRMAAILFGVTAFTLLAAVAGVTDGARRRHAQGRDTAFAQAAAFLAVFGAGLFAHAVAPHLLFADRLFPGLGAPQALVVGLGAAWLTGRLHPARRNPRS